MQKVEPKFSKNDTPVERHEKKKAADAKFAEKVNAENSRLSGRFPSSDEKPKPGEQPSLHYLNLQSRKRDSSMRRVMDDGAVEEPEETRDPPPARARR